MELLKPADPTSRFLQAKVTIALGKLPVYGCITSIGWQDLDGTQAAKVKEVRISLDRHHKHSINHDVGAEEWRLNLGVNGRWVHLFNDGVSTDHFIDIKDDVVLYLTEDDRLVLIAHGMEQDAEGDWFDHKDRVLRHFDIEFDDLPIDQTKLPDWIKKFGKIPKIHPMATVKWKGEIDDFDKPDLAHASALARDLRFWGFPAWAVPNDVLGHLRPVEEVLHPESDNDNGKLRDSLELQYCDHGLPPAHSDRKEKRDYTVHYLIKIKNQP